MAAAQRGRSAEARRRLEGHPVLGSLFRAAVHYHQDHDGLRAAAIGYYALLSFFPFTVLVGAASRLFVADAEQARQFFDSLRTFAPFLRDSFWEEVHALAAQHTVFPGASLLLLYFIASQVSATVERALRIIFRVGPPRELPWLRRVLSRAQGYAFTLVAVLALGAMFLARNVFTYLELVGVSSADRLAVAFDRPFIWSQLVPALTVAALTFLLFRRVPRARVKARWAALGACTFTAAHELATFLYGKLMSWQGVALDVAYGPFVGLMVLAVWVYWLAAMLLLSAELVAELNGNRDGNASRGGAVVAPGPGKSDTDLDTLRYGDDTFGRGTEPLGCPPGGPPRNENPPRKGGDPNEQF